jgi:acyl transferase domain-containing protein
LLKKLSNAIEDNDQIYAVIKSTSINHGGKTNGYTVPNPSAQAKLIQTALEKANLNARAISYIEAHGTGTELGDPIEITGLTQAFRKTTYENQYCSIGSVKSNIGHLEAAAGIAGLTKLVLQLKNKKLVPSLHAKELNPKINFAKTPFVVQQMLADWNKPIITENGISKEYPRIGSISAFGAGGSNAHIIVEEYIDEPRPIMHINAQNPAIIVLSAKNEDRLKGQIHQLIQTINAKPITNETLYDVAYTLQVGREDMDERLAIIVSSVEELLQKLSSFLQGKENISDLYYNQVKRNQEALAVFKADEEFDEVILKWIQKKKYSKVCDIWVKGVTIAWENMHQNVTPRIISLPTYPFKKQKFWIPENNSTSELIKSKAVISSQSQQQKIAQNKKEIKLTNEDDKKVVIPKVNIIAPSVSLDSVNLLEVGKPQGIVLQAPSIVANTKLEENIAFHPVKLSSEILVKPAQTRKPVQELEQVVTPDVHVQEVKPINNIEQKTTTNKVSPTINKKDVAEIEEILSQTLADVLSMSRAEVDLDTKLIDLGLDSIVSVEWIQAVNNHLGLSLPATVTYDYPTIRAFAAFLSNISEQSAVSNNQVDSELQNEAVIETEANLNLNKTTVELNNPEPEKVVQELNSLVISLGPIDQVQEFLVSSLAEVLSMSSTEIDVDSKFIDLGLDSIVSVEWIQAINGQYGLSLPAPITYDYPSVKAFSEFLVNLPKQAQAATQEISEVSEPKMVQSSPVEIAQPKQDMIEETKNATENAIVTSEPIQEFLISSLAEVLSMDAAEIDIDTKFIDLGLDSIISVEWVQAINRNYNTQIPAPVVYDHPSIREFTKFLESQSAGVPNSTRVDATEDNESANVALKKLLQQVQTGEVDIEKADQILEELHQSYKG